MAHLKACRLKLYPTKAQSAALSRYAGACRWLWNHLLAMQKERHAKDGTFIFQHDMSKLLPRLKKELPWLSEPPSHSLQRVCRNLDQALKKCFREKAGFPRFKGRGKCRDSFYVANHVFRIENNRVVLPKAGPVRFRTGRLPEGDIMGANVAWNGRAWELTVQCSMTEEPTPVELEAETVVGVDLGLTDLMIRSDGVRVKASKSLRKKMKQLRRAQRTLSRRTRGSANSRKQAKLVGRFHAKVRDTRRDAQHKASSAVVKAASAVVTETPNIQGMMKNHRVALSFSDAGWGEMIRQIDYKCRWAGKRHIRADRFEPSTQTCSACGERKTGSDKLRLSMRVFRCACGLVMDRDENAAMNLRRIGLQALNLTEIEDVGQAMPERVSGLRLRADACGEASGGRVAKSALSRASRKQEPMTCSTSEVG